MFYWVIPYLVAINCTKPEWRNGPVSLFEAEVNAKYVSATEATFYTNATMSFECRPNATSPSSLKCQVQNATLENYEMLDNNKTESDNQTDTWFEEFGPIVFHIEFDETGIKNLTFPEARGYYREMVIRSIFNNLNVGLDFTEKGFDHYNALDSTVFGDCPTDFNIQKITESNKDDQLLETPNNAERKFTILPFLDQFSDHQTILIEKERKANKCLNKQFYIFGSDQPSAFDRKKGLVGDCNIISSQSRIYLSPSGFNSVSEHGGTFRVGRKSEYSKNGNMMMVGKTFEKIRLTLQSVGPAEA